MYEYVVLLEQPWSLDDVQRHLRFVHELTGSAATLEREDGLLRVVFDGWALGIALADGPHVREDAEEMAARAADSPDPGALARCAHRLELAGGPDPDLEHMNDVALLLERLGGLPGAHPCDPRTLAELPGDPGVGPRLFTPGLVGAGEEPGALHVAAGQELGAAIERAPAGATLVLGPGSWPLQVPVRVTRALRIVGAGADRTKVTAAQGAAAMLEAADGADLVLHGLHLEKGGLLATGGALALEDCLLDLRGTRAAGVHVSDQASADLRHVAAIGGVVGVRLSGQAEATVEACWLRVDGVGVAFEDEAGGAVRGCVIREGATGVAVTGHCTPLVEDTRIVRPRGGGLRWTDDAGGVARRNEVVRPGRAGFEVMERARPLIEGNRVRDGAGAGVLLDDDARGVVRGNLIEAVGRSGVVIRGRAAPQVEGNKVAGAGEEGILVEGAGAPRVAGNQVEAAHRNGLTVQGEACPAVEENVVRGCRQAGLLWHTSATGGVVRRNRFEQSGEAGVEVRAAGSPRIEANLFLGNRRGGVVVADRARPTVQANRYEANGVGPVVALDQGRPEVVDDAPVVRPHPVAEPAGSAAAARATLRLASEPPTPSPESLAIDEDDAPTLRTRLPRRAAPLPEAVPAEAPAPKKKVAAKKKPVAKKTPAAKKKPAARAAAKKKPAAKKKVAAKRR